MKTSTLIAFACAAALNGFAATLSTAPCADPLVRFWRDNDGKSVRRLPVDVVPENVFWGFGTRDFPDGLKAFSRMIDESVAKSTYNCVTLTLRCNPELGDKETLLAAQAVNEKAHAAGIKVYMDTDPRIARREFFARWPNDMQGVAVVVTVAPTNGAAAFTYTFKDATDHMTGGARNSYRPVKARVADSFAVRRRADGAFDFSTRRPVDVTSEIAVRSRRDATGGGYMDRGDAVVSGKAADLAADETLVVTLEADYFSADLFSPHIIPFARELMARYKALGADGGMRDEWGFIPDHAPSLRKFWWSPNFEAAYRAACGRSLMDDFPLMAFGAKGDAVRASAIGTFMKLVLARNVEIERDFYETDKRLFGAGVYVAKHPTWHSAVCPQEYFHNGLDWWQAPRDWAQGDENAPIYALNAMAKKFGGPVWLNEGYTATDVRRPAGVPRPLRQPEGDGEVREDVLGGAPRAHGGRPPRAGQRHGADARAPAEPHFPFAGGFARRLCLRARAARGLERRRLERPRPVEDPEADVAGLVVRRLSGQRMRTRNVHGRW